MSGWLFLGVTALICAACFLNGVRFARMSENPLAGKRLLGMPVGGSEMPIEKVRRMGMLFMIAAPIFFLFVAALCFGLFGPVDGIQIIDLKGAQ